MNCDFNAEDLLRNLSAPRRNNFFYGKRMDVQHFQLEQNYGKLKRWLLNRLTLGKGVICGIDVSLSRDGKVCVNPGVAIDGLGREIIVPAPYCFDPFEPKNLCCHEDTIPETSTAAVGGTSQRQMTLWLCYRECKADYEPDFVSDCDSREHCSPGTIVETFCLKVTNGAAAPLMDPDWCGDVRPVFDSSSEDAESTSSPTHLKQGQSTGTEDALLSMRYRISRQLGKPCATDGQETCVPIALLFVSEKRIERIDQHVVRPRVYSNATLLDLILCLASRVEECCNRSSPTTMRVRQIKFLKQTKEMTYVCLDFDENEIPTSAVHINKDWGVNSIKITFTKHYCNQEYNKHYPRIHGAGETKNWDNFNVQLRWLERNDNDDGLPPACVLVDKGADHFSIQLDEADDNQNPRALRPGYYELILCGTDENDKLHSIHDIDGRPFDGEVKENTSGNDSTAGDGIPGGDFVLRFYVR